MLHTCRDEHCWYPQVLELKYLQIGASPAQRGSCRLNRGCVACWELGVLPVRWGAGKGCTAADVKVEDEPVCVCDGPGE